MFYINGSKTRKNGESPLMLRITMSGKVVTLRTKRFIKREDWNPEKGLAKPKSPDANNLNMFIEAFRAKAFNKYTELLTLHDEVSPEQLRDALLNVNAARGHSLMEIWQEHVDDLQKLIGIGSSYANYQKFYTCKRYVGDYLLHLFQVFS